jgi:hypothetical protein
VSFATKQRLILRFRAAACGLRKSGVGEPTLAPSARPL